MGRAKPIAGRLTLMRTRGGAVHAPSGDNRQPWLWVGHPPWLVLARRLDRPDRPELRSYWLGERDSGEESRGYPGLKEWRRVNAPERIWASPEIVEGW